MLAPVRAAAVIALLSLSANAEEINVDQRGIRFDKTEITVKAGATVHYHNRDDVTHNLMVLGDDEDMRDEGLQKPGESVAPTFDKEGTFEVRCAIHPRMKMNVTVEK